MMRLRVTGGPMDHTPFEFERGKVYIFGREPGSDGDFEGITLESKTVSRKHCRIEYQKGVGFLIRDLDSSNGIRVNRNKIREAFLKRGDIIQIGEFSFTVEEDGSSQKFDVEEKEVTGDKMESTNAGLATKEISKKTISATTKLREAGEEGWRRFEKLDLSTRFLVLLMVAGAVGHLFVTWPMMSDARQNLLKQSFLTAKKIVRSFAERNRQFLLSEQYGLLDCQILRDEDAVVSKTILDPHGKILCPPKTSDAIRDDLSAYALQSGELVDDCTESVLAGGRDNCELVMPISDYKAEAGQPVLLGAVKIVYNPHEAFEDISRMNTLSWKTFFLWLAILGGVWSIWRFWMKRLFSALAETLHSTASRGAQTVENPEHFAALDPLLQELNRMLSQRNQGLGSGDKPVGTEASFLQPLFNQMLLLEERAVMVVDKDNLVIAGSSVLENLIPVDLSGGWNRHLTEIVTDPHLQGDLMGFLNDVSAGYEILDRALSMADRVVQVRGMPIVLNSDYVAAVLLF